MRKSAFSLRALGQSFSKQPKITCHIVIRSSWGQTRQLQESWVRIKLVEVCLNMLLQGRLGKLQIRRSGVCQLVIGEDQVWKYTRLVVNPFLGDGRCNGNQMRFSSRCSQLQLGRGGQEEFPQCAWPCPAQAGCHSQLGKLTFCQSRCGVLTETWINKYFLLKLANYWSNSWMLDMYRISSSQLHTRWSSIGHQRLSGCKAMTNNHQTNLNFAIIR